MSDITLLSNEELLKLNNISVSTDGKLFEILASGCPTMALGSKGYTACTSATQYLLFGQGSALVHNNFGLHDICDNNHMLLKLYMECQVSLKFYKDRDCRRVYYPMKFSSGVHSVGKSTINMVTVLRHTVTNLPLASLYCTQVKVDRRKRQISQISDHIFNKFQHQSDQHQRYTGDLLSLTPPADTFQQMVLVRFSDTDVMEHVNYGSYNNYCFDAAVVAASQNKLEGFSSDVAPWFVRKMKCSYAADSTAGETLKVILWQDETSCELVHFRISKLDGQVCFACSIDFYLKEAEDDDTRLGLLVNEDYADIINQSFSNEALTISNYNIARLKHISFNMDRTRAETIMPGPLVLNLNQRGQLSLDRLAEYLDAAHYAIVERPGFCTSDYDMVPQNCGMFYVQLDYIFERELFKSSMNFQGLYLPMRTVVKFHSFSRSSIVLEFKLYDIETEACVATLYTKQVTVDYKTRKTLPIPDHQRLRYSQLCDNHEGLKAIPNLLPPGDCFVHYAVVRHSDIDVNQHMNMMVYIRLCLDATVSASENNSLGQFEGDAYGREVKIVRCSYVKECSEGEAVGINVWQDASCGDILNYRVTKNDGSLSMLCTMEFFPSGRHAKL